MKDDPNAWNRTTADFPHWEPPKGRGVHDVPPGNLCPPQRKAWLAWRDHIRKYNPSNPTEWPGGAHIMDSRTSHTTRRRQWIEKNAGQMEIVEHACANRGPQCDTGWHAQYAELEGALAPLRAANPGITLAEVSPLLPEHLRGPLWERAVNHYLAEAERKATETA